MAWKAFTLATAWVSLFVFWPVGLLPAMAWFQANRDKGWRRALLPLPFVAVPILSFAWGTATWITGSATFLVVGLPGPDLANPDPVWRVPGRSSGCEFDGSETFTHAPNNAAIMALTRVFGPMPGAYRGPYPDRAEAHRRIRSSPLTMPREEVVRELLHPPAGEKLLDAAGLTDASLRVVRIGGDAALLGEENTREGWTIAFFDLRRGKRVALWRFVAE